MLKIPMNELKSKLKAYENFYRLENLEGEIELWHRTWSDKNISNEQLKELDLSEVVKEASTFFLYIKHALNIANPRKLIFE